MKTSEIFKKNYDYIFPLIIWLLIFGKNIFSQLMFVDYVPDTYFTTIKTLISTNYAMVLGPIDILRLIFSLTGLLPYLFQFSILISMFISYFYIRKLFQDKQKTFSIVFSFIFFFNPFIYSRIMIGQVGVLIAYLFLPITIFYIFQFFESNLKTKSLLKLAIAITLCSLFSIHFFIINLIIFLTSAFWLYFQKKFSIIKFLILSITLFIILILLNSIWIQGILSSETLKSIDSSHENFFSPKLSGNIPAVAKIIGMSGFWRESAYSSTYNILGPIGYLIILALLLILFLAGYYLSHDKKSKIFFTLFWLGLILGTGIAHPYTRPFFNSLFNYLPFFNGFRDSHKLTSLIALSYAYLISVFALELKIKLKELGFLPVIILILFILFFTFPLLGLWNQIKPVSYPSSYNELNSFLDSKQITGKIIYLPWQTYLTYNWTINSSSDGRIAVPINNILKYPVIIGSDVYGSETIETQKILDCLNNKSTTCLEQNSVQFVINDKCSFYKDDKSSTFESMNKAYSNSCLDVYKLNSKPKPTQQIPLRFLVTSIVSLITFLVLIILLITLKKR